MTFLFRAPTAAEGAVELHHRDQLVQMGTRQEVLGGEELLLGFEEQVQKNGRPIRFWTHSKYETVTPPALAKMSGRTFTPWSAGARGLGLWRYLGGPWEPVAQFPFS